MRTKLIAGNWKMNTSSGEATSLAAAIAGGSAPDRVRLAVCPPFVYLDSVRNALAGSPVALGAQNCWYEQKGAFTGEVSAAMLADIGCRYVIIGHSERRTLFGETDESVNRKLRAVTALSMIPIFCVGETLHERESGVAFDVVQRQVERGLEDIESVAGDALVVAYEPVWAIGTGRAATAGQAQEVHAFIRSLLARRYGDEAHRVAILYGGSVTPDNAEELFSRPDIDGALVGGASLKADSFLRIAEAAGRVADSVHL